MHQKQFPSKCRKYTDINSVFQKIVARLHRLTTTRSQSHNMLHNSNNLFFLSSPDYQSGQEESLSNGARIV